MDQPNNPVKHRLCFFAIGHQSIDRMNSFIYPGYITVDSADNDIEGRNSKSFQTKKHLEIKIIRPYLLLTLLK